MSLLKNMALLLNMKLLVPVFLFMISPAKAQISISPTALYIHDETGIGSLQVANGPDAAREISISFEFGYPSSDTLGNLIMVYNDTTAGKRYGLVHDLRAFPRHFILQPGSQQIVRIRIMPRRQLTDGAYWSRMIIRSSPEPVDPAKENDDRPVSTNISYIFKQNIALFYLKGETTTGLNAGDIKTFVEGDELIILAALERSGNCPFNGNVSVRLYDEDDNEIIRHEQTIVVYFSILRRFQIKLPAGGLPPGNYTLKFTYKTSRGDISSSDLVHSESVHKNVPLIIR
jgi:hypothetical protein